MKNTISLNDGSHRGTPVYRVKIKVNLLVGCCSAHNCITDSENISFIHKTRLLCVQFMFASQPSAEYVVRNKGTGSHGCICNYVSLSAALRYGNHQCADIMQ